eukprot:9137755-Alexandrium_andersonii.AAC.1
MQPSGASGTNSETVSRAALFELRTPGPMLHASVAAPLKSVQFPTGSYTTWARLLSCCTCP